MSEITDREGYHPKLESLKTDQWIDIAVEIVPRSCHSTHLYLDKERQKTYLVTFGGISADGQRFNQVEYIEIP
jgi:hypothetical protein